MWGIGLEVEGTLGEKEWMTGELAPKATKRYSLDKRGCSQGRGRASKVTDSPSSNKVITSLHIGSVNHRWFDKLTTSGLSSLNSPLTLRLSKVAGTTSSNKVRNRNTVGRFERLPILDVEIVVPTGLRLDAGLAPSIAEAAGQAFGTPAGGTWVKLRTLSYEFYAEDGGPPPDNGWPVFVTVLKAKMPEPDALEREVIHLTTEIARICRRPRESVHILYLPEATGRMAFGGRIVSD